MSLYLGENCISAGGSSAFKNNNIGEIIQSTTPLTDAGLHLLDGGVIQRGSYTDFVDYIAGLVSTYPDLFTTEADWQTSVTNYGVCGKFVYNSTNNTVRLPKRTSEHGALIKSYSSGTDWYRIYSDGWCEQGGIVTVNYNTSTADVVLLKQFVDTDYSVLLTAGGYAIGGVLKESWQSKTISQFTVYGDYSSSTAENIPTTWFACGYIDISDYQYSPVYEYLVIATSTKTDIEVDIDEIATDLNGKVDKADLFTVHVVVETYQNDSNWYRLYDDGWCEQGGSFGSPYTTYTQKTFTFLKPFLNTKYFTTCHCAYTADLYYPSIVSKTPTDVTYYGTYNTNGNGNWYACGYTY